MLTAVRVKVTISNVVISAVGLGTVSCVRAARRQFPGGAGTSRLACTEIIQSTSDWRSRSRSGRKARGRLARQQPQPLMPKG